MMKKVLIFSLLIVAFIRTNAQSQPIQYVINNLEQKIDSLEHKIAFMELSSDFEKIITQLLIFNNELDSKVNMVTIFTYTNSGKRDRKFGETLTQMYKTCEEKLAALYHSVDTVKSTYELSLKFRKFSISELKALESAYKLLDPTLAISESALSTLKIAVEGY